VGKVVGVREHSVCITAFYEQNSMKAGDAYAFHGYPAFIRHRVNLELLADLARWRWKVFWYRWGVAGPCCMSLKGR